MVVASPWPLDVHLESLGLQVHLGDVASLGEFVTSQILVTLMLALAGLVAHASFVRLFGYKWARTLLVIGFGMAVASFPFVALSMYRVRSRLTAFVFSYSAVLGFFRWVELVVGRGPKGSAANSFVFALYFGAPCEILFEDGKMRRLRHRFTACKDLAIEIVLHFLLFLVLNSIARETAFLPFLEHGKHPASLQWYGWPRALPALYLQTYMVYGMMALAMLVHRMVAAVLGLDTLVTFKLPLLLSTSLREFWGRRWNLLIHNLMKRCFFEPFRTGPAWQRYVGGILAFLMSGVFHEYMWLILHAARPDESRYGACKVLAFFMLQFVVTAAEAVFSKSALGHLVAKVPGPVLTFLVTLAMLPWSPLFLEGVHDLICELPYTLPSLEAKDSFGVGLRSAALCVLAVVPVAFLTWRSSEQELKASGEKKDN